MLGPWSLASQDAKPEPCQVGKLQSIQQAKFHHHRGRVAQEGPRYWRHAAFVSHEEEMGETVVTKPSLRAGSGEKRPVGRADDGAW